MLQATVSCANGLACLNPLSPPPTVTSANTVTSATAAETHGGQGKKGKNKGKPSSTVATPTSSSSTNLIVDSAEVSKMALADVQVNKRDQSIDQLINQQYILFLLMTNDGCFYLLSYLLNLSYNRLFHIFLYHIISYHMLSSYLIISLHIILYSHYPSVVVRCSYLKF